MDCSNFYNTAMALSVLTCVAFLASFSFDVMDLRRTRSPPRLKQQRLVEP